MQPGVTTDFIDRKVHEMAVANGAYPSPLGYGLKSSEMALILLLNSLLLLALTQDLAAHSLPWSAFPLIMSLWEASNFRWPRLVSLVNC